MKNNLDRLKLFEGKELGKSQWLTITQDMVNKFAEATFDNQWIHTDVERAKQAFPDTGTILHGFYTLSLSSKFVHEIVSDVAQKVNSWPNLKDTTKINYGCNKVRFLAKVPVGTPIRGSVKMLTADITEKYVDSVYQITIEIEGKDKPAMVAENIVRYIPF